MRKSHPAFHMGTAELVRNNLTFLPVKQKNVVAYKLDGKAVGDSWNNIIVILNSNTKAVSVPVEQGNYTVVVADGKVDLNGMRQAKGKTVKVSPQSALIMYQ